MKKYKLSFIISTIIIVIITMVTFFFLFINKFLEPYYQPNKEKIEQYFNQDKEDIILIKNYFENYNASISINDLEFKATNYKKIIQDKNVVSAMENLFEKRGYSEIGKTSSTIYFQKWTRGANASIGIAYDNAEPSLEFLVRFESLLENGWYFYETNYNG